MAEELVQILPDVCIDHDNEKFHIEIELPGVKKEDIDLQMGEASLCINAAKEEFAYAACYTLAHKIDVGNTTAKFENGLLTVLAPFTSPIGGTKITIE